jgi:hypothetical protein
MMITTVATGRLMLKSERNMVISLLTCRLPCRRGAEAALATWPPHAPHAARRPGATRAAQHFGRPPPGRRARDSPLRASRSPSLTATFAARCRRTRQTCAASPARCTEASGSSQRPARPPTSMRPSAYRPATAGPWPGRAKLTSTSTWRVVALAAASTRLHAAGEVLTGIAVDAKAHRLPHAFSSCRRSADTTPSKRMLAGSITLTSSLPTWRRCRRPRPCGR